MTVFNLGLELYLKQKIFFSCPAEEILYGGAAGGSKTFSAAIKSLIFAMKNPGIHIGIFRRSLPELRMTLLKEAQARYPTSLYHYKEQSRTLSFRINKSIITFNYIESDKDLLNYKGVEFDVIQIDEGVDNTEYQITYLKSRLRSSRVGFRTRLNILTNPLGVSHGYLFDRYIKGKVPFKLYATPETKNLSPDKQRFMCFIPAKLTDNPALFLNDPGYIYMLRELGDDEFIALLLGSWTTKSGMFFLEWEEQLHMLPSYIPVSTDALYISHDWGSAKPSSTGFYAVTREDTSIRFDEIYTIKPGEPDTGLNLNAIEVALLIKDKVMIHRQMYGLKYHIMILDSQCWAKDGSGFSIYELMYSILGPIGIVILQAKKDRISGAQSCRKFLMMNPQTGKPWFQVASKCIHFLRTVPLLLHDPRRDGDVDTRMEDHAYDEWRYFIESVPKPRSMATVVIPPINTVAYFDWMKEHSL